MHLTRRNLFRSIAALIPALVGLPALAKPKPSEPVRCGHSTGPVSWETVRDHKGGVWLSRDVYLDAERRQRMWDNAWSVVGANQRDGGSPRVSFGIPIVHPKGFATAVFCTDTITTREGAVLHMPRLLGVGP